MHEHCTSQFCTEKIRCRSFVLLSATTDNRAIFCAASGRLISQQSNSSYLGLALALGSSGSSGFVLLLSSLDRIGRVENKQDKFALFDKSAVTVIQ